MVISTVRFISRGASQACWSQFQMSGAVAFSAAYWCSTGLLRSGSEIRVTRLVECLLGVLDAEGSVVAWQSGEDDDGDDRYDDLSVGKTR